MILRVGRREPSFLTGVSAPGPGGATTVPVVDGPSSRPPPRRLEFSESVKRLPCSWYDDPTREINRAKCSTKFTNKRLSKITL